MLVMASTDWWTYGERYNEAKAENNLKMASGHLEGMMAALGGRWDDQR